MSDSPLSGPAPGDPLSTWGEHLAAGTATPGGGSATAIAVAMSAGLAAMVARLAAARSEPDGAAALQAVAAEADEKREAALRLAEADWRAVSAVFEVLKQSQTTPEARDQRKSALQRAWAEAARVPLELVRIAARVATLARLASEGGHRNSWGDAAAGIVIAAAGAQVAALMLELDLQGLGGSDAVQMIAEGKRLAADARKEAERMMGGR